MKYEKGKNRATDIPHQWKKEKEWEKEKPKWKN